MTNSHNPLVDYVTEERLRIGDPENRTREEKLAFVQGFADRYDRMQSVQAQTDKVNKAVDEILLADEWEAAEALVSAMVGGSQAAVTRIALDVMADEITALCGESVDTFRVLVYLWIAQTDPVKLLPRVMAGGDIEAFASVVRVVALPQHPLWKLAKEQVERKRYIEENSPVPEDDGTPWHWGYGS